MFEVFLISLKILARKRYVWFLKTFKKHSCRINICHGGVQTCMKKDILASGVTTIRQISAKIRNRDGRGPRISRKDLPVRCRFNGRTIFGLVDSQLFPRGFFDEHRLVRTLPLKFYEKLPLQNLKQMNFKLI